MKRAIALALMLLVAAYVIGQRLRADAPPAPEASRIGVGPLVGGVLTGAFRPLLMNYLYLRADILAGQGRYDEEVTLFKTMVQLYPHNESARAFIGWWLAFNAKSEAPDPALGWRWAEPGLDILIELPDERATLSRWFLLQCGHNAIAAQRYAGKGWAEEIFFRERARRWGERHYGAIHPRFDLGLLALGEPDGFKQQSAQVRLLITGLIDDWMRAGASPKLGPALRGLEWLAEVFKGLPGGADAPRAEAARLKAIDDGSFELQRFPDADINDANALWALGMHKRDFGRLLAAQELFKQLSPEGAYLPEIKSTYAWTSWIELGQQGARPPMPFDR